MNIKLQSPPDPLDEKILRELQRNARTSYREIGRRVGLSSPAVAERVHKMMDAGIIEGFHAKVEPEKIGFPISAFIYLTSQPEKYLRVYAFAENTPEILECHCISGTESFLLRVIARDIPHLNSLVDQLSAHGATKTSMVLSSPVRKNSIEI